MSSTKQIDDSLQHYNFLPKLLNAIRISKICEYPQWVKGRCFDCSETILKGRRFECSETIYHPVAEDAVV